MRLLGRNKLQSLSGLGQDTSNWLRNWVSELSHANWKGQDDVLKQFPKASCTDGTIFQFPVAQQAYSIEVTIMFPLALAIVSNIQKN